MLAIDGHVHLYPVFSSAALLDAAADNFRRLVPEVGEGLLAAALTPAESLVEFSGGLGEATSWMPAEGIPNRWVRRRDGFTIEILPGVQRVSAEGLELLAFPGDAVETLPRATAARDWCATALEAGAVVVLPFGVGKWRGSRGVEVRQLLEHFGEALVVGDNANRLGTGSLQSWLSGYSGWVLPGSDPLPFRGLERRAGCYGLAVPEARLGSGSGEALFRRILRGESGEVRPIGGASAPLEFLYWQLRMQVRKFRAKQ